MWKVFNNKNYMAKCPTDQNIICCTIDIETVFHDLLNRHYDIGNDSEFIFLPLVNEFMLKGQKNKDLFSFKKIRSLMKQFDIYLCCKLCVE